jgi:hypothetical protein
MPHLKFNLGRHVTIKSRSIHVDRSGNIEVEDLIYAAKNDSRTAELIDAWSNRSTASSSHFYENAHIIFVYPKVETLKKFNQD